MGKPVCAICREAPPAPPKPTEGDNIAAAWCSQCRGDYRYSEYCFPALPARCHIDFVRLKRALPRQYFWEQVELPSRRLVDKGEAGFVNYDYFMTSFRRSNGQPE